MIMELGRLTFPVKLDTVKSDKKGEMKVLNNKLAISLNKTQTTFIDIVAWNTTAELINNFYKKGFEILVQGHLINNIKKRENVEFETVVLVVDKVIFTHGQPKSLPEELNPEEYPDFLKSGGEK